MLKAVIYRQFFFEQCRCIAQKRQRPISSYIVTLTRSGLNTQGPGEDTRLLGVLLQLAPDGLYGGRSMSFGICS